MVVRVLVRVAPGFRPVQGDGFDAVVAALEFAGVPAVVEEERATPAGERRTLRGVATAQSRREHPPCLMCGAYDPEHVPGCELWVCGSCGDEVGVDGCQVCDTCKPCCSC